MHEEAVRLGHHDNLTGVVTLPDQAVNAPALILLNAGMIHHVGPSRLYVRLARQMAQHGFTALRFDFSGIGDSGARVDNLPIEQAVVDDVQQAMNFLTEHSGIARFILIGHCAGAWASLLTASVDNRVCGTVVMNPDGGGDDWVEYDRQRKVSRFYEQYYSREALTNPERWKKLLTGKADYGSITRNVVQNIFLNRLSTAAFKIRHKLDRGQEPERPETSLLLNQMMQGFIQHQTQLLLLFSEGSSAIEHIHTVLGRELDTLMQSGAGTEVIVSNADHTFTLLAGQYTAINHIENWCADFLTAPARR